MNSKRRRGLRAAQVALVTGLSAVMVAWTAAQQTVAPPSDDVDIDLGFDCIDEDPLSDCPHGKIIPNKSLFITDLCVVEDKCRTRWDACDSCSDDTCGAWTFGKLMASIAGFSSIDEDPVALSNFVEEWFKQFAQPTVVENGIVVAPRPNLHQTIIDRWHQVSPGNHLDMRLAPFRLLAIVNRVDLRSEGSYSDSLAGEGRFIFGMLNINPSIPDPSQWFALRGTLILEYELPATKCDDAIKWGHMWRDLSDIPFGPSYNKALQAVTDQFAGFGAGGSGKPNMSALAQARTNEVIGGPWELREFQLLGFGSGVPLTQTTVAQTVDDSFNNQPAGSLLEQYITADQLAIINDQHEIPLFFGGQPFRAGSSFVHNPLDIWNVPSFDCSETRHKFAINNCNGCHAAEAGLFDCSGTGLNFTHVDIREMGHRSKLSRFLTGDPNGVEDLSCPPSPAPNSHNCFSPATFVNHGATIRYMHDLHRRSLDLCDLVGSSCNLVVTLSIHTDPELEAVVVEEKEILDIFDSEHLAGNRVH